MPKWKYTQIKGVSIIDVGRSNINIFELDNPRVNLYSENEIIQLFFKIPETKVRTLWGKIVEIQENIKEYFPKYIFTQEELLGYKTFPRASLHQLFEDRRSWEWDEWRLGPYQQFLIHKFLITLLNDHWELLDREGFWFRKKIYLTTNFVHHK